MSERCPACGLHDCARECPIGRGAVSRAVYDEITARYVSRLDAAEKENAFSRKWIHELRDNPLHGMLLERIQELMPSDPPADSPDGIKLSALAELCEAYEKRVVEKLDPFDAAIERDAKAGKLDWLANEARDALKRGDVEDL